jgi:hypothetical protein
LVCNNIDLALENSSFEIAPSLYRLFKEVSSSTMFALAKLKKI